MDTEQLPELLTTAEVAREFRVSKPTITRWRRAGLLPFVMVGRTSRYRRDDVLQILTSTTASDNVEVAS